METYNKLRRPPASALRPIAAGRLKGKTDISPQWRIEAMTGEFGLCGVGWKYNVTNRQIVDGLDGQKFVFVDVELFYQRDGKWSDPVPGSGGDMLIVKESSGMHHNHEAFKMATTDALGVAMRTIGMAADVYMGLWLGDRYVDEKPILKKGTPLWDKAVEQAKKGVFNFEVLENYDISENDRKELESYIP